MGDHELEVHGKLGLPEIGGFAARIETRYKGVWSGRSQRLVEQAAEQAQLEASDFAERVEGDERLGDIFAIARDRAGVVADGHYREVLARLVAAACDESRIDETSYLLAQIVKLEPVHVRALVAAPSLPPVDFKAEDLADRLGIMPLLARSVLQTLATFDLVTNLEADEDAGIADFGGYAITEWGHRVLEFIARSGGPSGEAGQP